MATKRRGHWVGSIFLGTMVWLLLAVSCAPGFDVPSDVNTLRILSVVADKPYAQPGDDVTLRMTVHDGLVDPANPDDGPRALQIVWIGGCVDPPGDQFFLCFEQLAEVFESLGGGEVPPPEVFKTEVSLATNSGVPNAHEFTINLPDDIISRRPVPETGSHYGIAYVFQRACAGQIAPAPLESLGGAVPEFPLQCLDAAGNKLGSESFVVGYTQVYAFADGRVNENPPVNDITLDGVPLADDIANAAVVERCPVSEDDRRVGGCGSADPTAECKVYELKALIDDVAEVDPEGTDQDGNPLREVVWVSYYADAGEFDPSLALVSDATTGYLPEHETMWIPPDEPGIVTFWAVVRDQRGSTDIVRRYVRVE